MSLLPRSRDYRYLACDCSGVVSRTKDWAGFELRDRHKEVLSEVGYGDSKCGEPQLFFFRILLLVIVVFKLIFLVQPCLFPLLGLLFRMIRTSRPIGVTFPLVPSVHSRSGASLGFTRLGFMEIGICRYAIASDTIRYIGSRTSRVDMGYLAVTYDTIIGVCIHMLPGGDQSR